MLVSIYKEKRSLVKTYLLLGRRLRLEEARRGFRREALISSQEQKCHYIILVKVNRSWGDAYLTRSGSISQLQERPSPPPSTGLSSENG
jgi:hypothetical protein